MRCRLLSLLTALSLLLCVAVCVVWLGSIGSTDSLTLRGRGGSLLWAISRNHCIEVTLVRDAPVAFRSHWASVRGFPLTDYDNGMWWVRRRGTWDGLAGSICSSSGDVSFEVGASTNLRPAWRVRAYWWVPFALTAALPVVRASSVLL